MTKILQKLLIFSLLIILDKSLAFAHDPAKKIFAKKIFSSFETPTSGDSLGIGSYARGCLSGGKLLPETGNSWQVMRTSRKRNWGHSTTIDFVKRYSNKVKKYGWPGLYVGDIGQPRGGPLPYGHKSHQIGLDVDIWLTKPHQLNLTVEEREKLIPKSVRSKDHRSLNNNWTPEHMDILREAALDTSVDRIFITAPAKIWMCRNVKGDKNWLQKIRPLGGHNAHFHIRLKCPKSDPSCVTQRPSISEISQSEDGCDHTLEWWVTTALEPPKSIKKTEKKKAIKKNALTFLPEDLPEECKKVMHAN